MIMLNENRHSFFLSLFFPIPINQRWGIGGVSETLHEPFIIRERRFVFQSVPTLLPQYTTFSKMMNWYSSHKSEITWALLSNLSSDRKHGVKATFDIVHRATQLLVMKHGDKAPSVSYT